jgi:hypothetical protein
MARTEKRQIRRNDQDMRRTMLGCVLQCSSQCFVQIAPLFWQPAESQLCTKLLDLPATSYHPHAMEQTGGAQHPKHALEHPADQPDPFVT